MTGAGPSTAGGDSRPWIEKYRPKSLDDVAAHADIVSTIRKLMQEDRLPHLLFYGPPGTGKTSTILAVAREMYGTSLSNMTLELNASDDRGINVVRQEVQEFASTRRIFSSGFKLVILDECDAMTKDAQFALRRIIEKYTRNTRFCLICNYASKIIPALQSRCTRFRFAPLPREAVVDRLQHIVDAEGVQIDGPGKEAVIRLGAGDMRRTLNILQSAHMAAGAMPGMPANVTEASVYSCTGSPLPEDIDAVARLLLNEPLAHCMAAVKRAQLDKGLALPDLLRELHPFVMRINMGAEAQADLVEAMADIEHRLAFGTSEQLQLGALVDAFVRARGTIHAAAA
ncbi:unnamed protein product [Pedinophyceae sp. YPF-701]|nr:unnamed protein product [Pedinophyceae sp. YPF-701]